MKEQEKYLELAKNQFYELKEETLKDVSESMGAENELDYEIDGEKFKIKVDGFWEKATWFNWEVFNEQGESILSGTYL